MKRKIVIFKRLCFLTDTVVIVAFAPASNVLGTVKELLFLDTVCLSPISTYAAYGINYMYDYFAKYQDFTVTRSYCNKHKNSLPNLINPYLFVNRKRGNCRIRNSK